MGKILFSGTTKEVSQIKEILNKNNIKYHESVTFGLDVDIIDLLVEYSSQAAVIVNCIISYINLRASKNAKAILKDKRAVNISNKSTEQIEKLIPEIEKIILEDN